jgi:hypothetical protein
MHMKMVALEIGVLVPMPPKVGGHFLDVLQWARNNSCPWDAYTCEAAAQGGRLDMLQWARTNGCPWDASTCTTAVGFRHWAVLQWARANGCPPSIATID